MGILRPWLTESELNDAGGLLPQKRTNAGSQNSESTEGSTRDKVSTAPQATFLFLLLQGYVLFCFCKLELDFVTKPKNILELFGSCFRSHSLQMKTDKLPFQCYKKMLWKSWWILQRFHYSIVKKDWKSNDCQKNRLVTWWNDNIWYQSALKRKKDDEKSLA